jgi:hypothetical protein
MVTIGLFFELPDGRIAFCCGANSIDKTVRYRFDGDEILSASYEESDSWKERRDLKDFPNAKDPRLPDEFDFIHDLKYMSQLKRELSLFRDPELLAMMDRHGIVCEPESETNSEELLDTRIIEMALGTLPEIKPRMDLDRYIVIHEAAGKYFANAYCISRDYTHSLAFFTRMANDIKIDFPELKDDEIECRIVNKSRLCLNCSVIKFSVPVETTKEGWLKHTFSTEWPEWSVSDF